VSEKNERAAAQHGFGPCLRRMDWLGLTDLRYQRHRGSRSGATTKMHGANHFDEIVERTGLARATVSSVELVEREEERFKYDPPFRGPRVYYTPSPLATGHLRIVAPSN